MDKISIDVFVQLSAKLKKRIDIERPDVWKKIKVLPSDRFDRLKRLFERIDLLDLHQTCVDSMPDDWIKNKTEFCSSPEWMSWQYIRLTDVIVQDYYCLRQKGGGPGDKTAEHDKIPRPMLR